MIYRNNSNINYSIVSRPLVRSRSKGNLFDTIPNNITSESTNSKLDINLSRHRIRIKDVTPKEALILSNIMIRSIIFNDWIYTNKNKELDKNLKIAHLQDNIFEVFDGIFGQELKDYQKNRNSKCNDTYNTLQLISNLAHAAVSESINQEKLYFFASFFRGVPVGILVLSDATLNRANGIPIIRAIATHMGTRNCGRLLIEYAVNKSQKLDHYGVVQLEPVANAKPAYLRLGFTEDTDDWMVLDPARQGSKWHLIDGNYRLRQII
ncbi:hypothetical protein [Xenorhabdus miraniensis]|uniref:N-acetyltransferase n=1 Tax=Xenorhabdus miraniensis TaxID=351674 RepID=A0A2D0JWR5_9GAMM|nr:hypothetical protein [Xenorhabdus miraniensis]PHM50765.1 N-acetyltransferase [Xenorhabdus miraniensis]